MSKFKYRLTSFKEIKNLDRINTKDNKKDKSEQLNYQYRLGKKYASFNNWSDAQQCFKLIYAMGIKSRLIQVRLYLLNYLITLKEHLDDLYTSGRQRRYLKVPDIDADAYLPNIDYVICVGVYKWAGDIMASDNWSQLLRCIKKGRDEAENAAIKAAITLFQCISLESDIREQVDLIVPVPPDPERIKSRRFNIPTLLSKVISKYSSIPMFEDILIKKLSTPERSGYLAISHSLVVDKTDEIRGKNILLIDDITTHGHTFLACGKKLKTAGAELVYAAALAHSEPSSRW